MKKIVTFCLLALLLQSCVYKNTETVLPRAQASRELEDSLSSYLAAARKNKLRINSIMVIQHGKVLAESYVGFPQYKPHYMMSCTKTFTSMAVGFAIEEGKLSLDEKMADIFPEEAAAVLDTLKDENWRKFMLDGTIKDYLVMGTGHDSDVFMGVFQKYNLSPMLDDHGKAIDRAFEHKGIDTKKEFFAQPFIYAPGTHNFYDNEGSHMLSCAVQKRVGQKISDYLQPRLFEPLGIAKPFWDEIQGCSSGGWGLFLYPEEMAKFGLCLLDGGRYEGKQVIPEWYVKEASQRCFSWDAPSWASEEEGRSYFQGYGYQMWMNSDAFCCAGAHGQLICMLPEHDAVIVTTAKIHGDDHDEMGLVWKHILPALH